MKKFFIILFLALTFGMLSFLVPQTAKAGWVNGYSRADGTYVPGYWRSNPNGLKYDNYSWDGNWAEAYNDSYYSPTRNYSSSWYTPSWITQKDYSIGKSFYDSRNRYSTYDYNSFDYDYNFWDDPVYSYRSTYNYDLTPRTLYTPYSTWTPRSYYTPYRSNYFNNYGGYSSNLYNNYNYLDNYTYDSYDLYDYGY